ncbi:MAG: hypothetical protein PHF79_00575 [Candidatus Pacebacteria bacterium]|nr:hypothetical protein [Candidatus Paceibacterota bacterium]
MERLCTLVRQSGTNKSPEALAVRLACDDFNIPINESCCEFNLKANLIPSTESLNGELEKVRAKHTLSILCGDLSQIWNRQGKLFPSQIKEVENILKTRKQKIEEARQAIVSRTQFPAEVKEALCVRYGLGSYAEVNPDPKVFAQMVNILNTEVEVVLRGVWRYLANGKSEAIASDQEYWKAVEEVEYSSLLLKS